MSSKHKGSDAARQDSRAGGPIDALELLKADHDRVRALFRQFEQIRGSDEHDERKAELSEEICAELTLHGMLEEELFYPAVRAAIGTDDMIDEAELEHASARDLIGQLEVMYPGDEHFDATVTVLGEEVERHIHREEHDIFPAAKKAGVALPELGEQLRARREELEEDLTSPPAHFDQSARSGSARRPVSPPD